MENIKIFKMDDYSWYAAHNLMEFLNWYNKHIDSIETPDDLSELEIIEPEDGTMWSNENITQEDVETLGDADEICRGGEQMRVTEREICGSFRRAENQKQQIQILTELTCKSKYQIIGILLRNGEKVPKSIENQLFKRLDALDAQIFECEMEYKEIVTALTGENRRKEDGNRIQRHGRTEQEQQGRT